MRILYLFLNLKPSHAQYSKTKRFCSCPDQMFNNAPWESTAHTRFIHHAAAQFLFRLETFRFCTFFSISFVCIWKWTAVGRSTSRDNIVAVAAAAADDSHRRELWDVAVFSIARMSASQPAMRCVLCCAPHTVALADNVRWSQYHMHIHPCAYNMAFLMTDMCSNNSYAISVHFCRLNAEVVDEGPPSKKIRFRRLEGVCYSETGELLLLIENLGFSSIKIKLHQIHIK